MIQQIAAVPALLVATGILLVLAGFAVARFTEKRFGIEYDGDSVSYRRSLLVANIIGLAGLVSLLEGFVCCVTSSLSLMILVHVMVAVLGIIIYVIYYAYVLRYVRQLDAEMRKYELS